MNRAGAIVAVSGRRALRVRRLPHSVLLEEISPSARPMFIAACQCIMQIASWVDRWALQHSAIVAADLDVTLRAALPPSALSSR